MRKFLFLLILLISGPIFAQTKYDLGQLCPEADKFIRQVDPFNYFDCYGQGEFLGVCFKASDVISDVQGFSGPIDVLICIDKEAIVKGIKVLRHSEMPGYGDRIESKFFLEQFTGKSVYDDFLVGQDIDGITQATVSASSICRIVRQSSRKVYQNILKGKSLPQATFVFSWQDLAFIIYLLLVCLSVLRRSVFLRVFFLLFVVFYFGFYKNLFISVFNFVQAYQVGIPHFREAIIWYILLGVSFLGALVVGRFYCGWLCPFGALQEVLSRTNLPRVNVPFTLNKSLLKIKYGLLIAAIFVFFFFKRDYLFRIEPFIYIFNPGFLSPFFYYGIFVLIISLFIPRFFCRYLCFVGAFLAVLSKVSVVKYKIRCKEDNCSICRRRCPVGVIDKENNIMDYECIRCNRCQKCSLVNSR